MSVREAWWGKINYVAEVACGKCGDEFLGVTQRGNRPASEVLRNHGWKRTKSVGWICPSCTRESHD